jgi:hypothetical protein
MPLTEGLKHCGDGILINYCVSGHYQFSCFYLNTLYVCMKIVFLCCYMQRICRSGNNFYAESALILTTTAVKQCMDIGTRPHVCGVF